MIDKSRLDNVTLKVLSSEISCMERLSHPNLVRLFEVIDRHQSVNIIMEGALGGNLQDRVNNSGPMEENFRRNVFTQIASGVHYMVNYKKYSHTCTSLSFIHSFPPYIHFLHTCTFQSSRLVKLGCRQD